MTAAYCSPEFICCLLTLVISSWLFWLVFGCKICMMRLFSKELNKETKKLCCFHKQWLPSWAPHSLEMDFHTGDSAARPYHLIISYNFGLNCWSIIIYSLHLVVKEETEWFCWGTMLFSQEIIRPRTVFQNSTLPPLNGKQSKHFNN
jgi:hypothetical protein